MLDRLVDLLRPGGVLVTDNVLWDGEVVPGYVAEPKRTPSDTAAIAAYNERLAADPAADRELPACRRRRGRGGQET